MNKLLAQEIVAFTHDVFEKSTVIVSAAKMQLNENDLQSLSLALGEILGATFLLAKPIFDEFPDLKPAFFTDDDAAPTKCQI